MAVVVVLLLHVDSVVRVVVFGGVKEGVSAAAPPSSPRPAAPTSRRSARPPVRVRTSPRSPPPPDRGHPGGSSGDESAARPWRGNAPRRPPPSHEVAAARHEGTASSWGAPRHPGTAPSPIHGFTKLRNCSIRRNAAHLAQEVMADNADALLFNLFFPFSTILLSLDTATSIQNRRMCDSRAGRNDTATYSGFQAYSQDREGQETQDRRTKLIG